MGRYILRRTLQAIPLLAIIAVIVFFLLKLTGDPLAIMAQDPRVRERDRALMRAKFGLDEPVFPQQFVTWLIGDDWRLRDSDGDGIVDKPGGLKGILRLDFGNSFQYQRPVLEVVGMYLPNTLLLGITAFTVTILVSLGIGILAALRPYSTFDNVFTTFAFITYSFPIFLIALLLVQVFAVWFKEWGLPYLPVQGMYSARGSRTVADLAWHLILPVTSLALIQIAGYSRYIRASMLEVVNSDYVRTARSKGLQERRVVLIHALKNASLPIVTLIGLDIPFILSGAVVTERIFGWPGMGQLFIGSLDVSDAPILIFFVLMTAVAVVFFQLVTDVLYAVLDPRVRYS